MDRGSRKGPLVGSLQPALPAPLCAVGGTRPQVLPLLRSDKPPRVRRCWCCRSPWHRKRRGLACAADVWLAPKWWSSRIDGGRARIGIGFVRGAAPSTRSHVFAPAFPSAAHCNVACALARQLCALLPRSLRLLDVLATSAYRLDALVTLRAMDCMRMSARDVFVSRVSVTRRRDRQSRSLFRPCRCRMLARSARKRECAVSIV